MGCIGFIDSDAAGVWAEEPPMMPDLKVGQYTG